MFLKFCYLDLKIELLTDIDMLLMVKALEEEYFTQFIDMQKLITFIRKTMNKIKNHHILNTGN